MKKSIQIQHFIELSLAFHRFFWKSGVGNGPKQFSTKSFRIYLFDNFFRECFFGSPIPIPNDPKIPKITLRTACDQYKITKSEHEKKRTFFQEKHTHSRESIDFPRKVKHSREREDRNLANFNTPEHAYFLKIIGVLNSGFCRYKVCQQK